MDVENIGVAPDIEVENIPSEMIKGNDPQLERAVREALKLLEQTLRSECRGLHRLTGYRSHPRNDKGVGVSAWVKPRES
jgi:C-terminal processing protease CtpA/Prc